MSVSFARLCSDEFRGKGMGKREGASDVGWAASAQSRCRQRVSDRAGGGRGSAAQQPSSLHCFLYNNQSHLWGRNILFGLAKPRKGSDSRSFDPLEVRSDREERVWRPQLGKLCAWCVGQPVTVTAVGVSSECDSAFQIRSWPAFLRTRLLAACFIHKGSETTQGLKD